MKRNAEPWLNLTDAFAEPDKRYFLRTKAMLNGLDEEDIQVKKLRWTPALAFACAFIIMTGALAAGLSGRITQNDYVTQSDGGAITYDAGVTEAPAEASIVGADIDGIFHDDEFDVRIADMAAHEDGFIALTVEIKQPQGGAAIYSAAGDLMYDAVEALNRNASGYDDSGYLDAQALAMLMSEYLVKTERQLDDYSDAAGSKHAVDCGMPDELESGAEAVLTPQPTSAPDMDSSDGILDASIGIIGGSDGPTAIFVTGDKSDSDAGIIGGADGPTTIFVIGDESETSAYLYDRIQTQLEAAGAMTLLHPHLTTGENGDDITICAADLCYSEDGWLRLLIVGKAAKPDFMRLEFDVYGGGSNSITLPRLEFPVSEAAPTATGYASDVSIKELDGIGIDSAGEDIKYHRSTYNNVLYTSDDNRYYHAVADCGMPAPDTARELAEGDVRSACPLCVGDNSGGAMWRRVLPIYDNGVRSEIVAKYDGDKLHGLSYVYIDTFYSNQSDEYYHIDAQCSIFNSDDGVELRTADGWEAQGKDVCPECVKAALYTPNRLIDLRLHNDAISATFDALYTGVLEENMGFALPEMPNAVG